MPSSLNNNGQVVSVNIINDDVVFYKNGSSLILTSGSTYQQLIYTDTPQIFLAKIYKPNNVLYTYRIDTRTPYYSSVLVSSEPNIKSGFHALDLNFEYYNTYIDSSNRFYIDHPGFTSPMYMGIWGQDRNYNYNITVDSDTIKIYYSHVGSTEQIYFDEYLVKDFIPPVIGLIQPNYATGYQYSTSAVNLIFDITDNETVSSAYIAYKPLSGSTWTSAALVPSAYSGYYGTSAYLPYGPYQATVYAIDNTEIETTRDISFSVVNVVANTPPIISLMSPAYTAGYQYSANNISVLANILDNGSVSASYIAYKEIANSTWLTGYMSVYDINSYSAGFTLPYGSYQANMTAIDDVGLSSNVLFYFSIVDINPPLQTVPPSVIRSPNTPYYHAIKGRFENY